jgi:Leucine-rich repeat (LRR) protein
VSEWSKNCDLIKQSYIKQGKKVKTDLIEQYFSSLKLNEKNVKQYFCLLMSDIKLIIVLKKKQKKIDHIDQGLKDFTKLEELTLTCNQISECDAANLPSSLKVLDLSGNYLQELEKINNRSMCNLQHLGLSLNWIYRFKLEPELWYVSSCCFFLI